MVYSTGDELRSAVTLHHSRPGRSARIPVRGTFSFLEFFAGGGMVRSGLGEGWQCLFANDFDTLKVRTYSENWGASEINRADIHALAISDLPPARADLAWASFPCQDLSCAGNRLGIGETGDDLKTRSGTFWPFVGLLRSMKRRSIQPRTVVLENVPGMLITNDRKDFCAVISAISSVGYKVGAAVIDARHFVPQSRPRIFIVGISSEIEIPPRLASPSPIEAWHPKQLVDAVAQLPKATQTGWIWFDLGPLPRPTKSLERIVSDDPELDWHTSAETKRLIDMMSDGNLEKVTAARQCGVRRVGTISLRMRKERGKKIQRAEVNFDGVAGCLRTPKGGGSRPRIIVVEGRKIRSRLLLPKEGAKLMGLPAAYKVPEVYHHAFRVLGDGVVVPVVSFLRDRLLAPVIDGHRAARDKNPDITRK